MAFLAFPIRLSNGVLQTCDEREAIFALVKIMAWTPHGSWHGSSHFGLRDFFEKQVRLIRPTSAFSAVNEQAGPVPVLPEGAVREANLAFEELGVTNHRLKSIVHEPQTLPSVHSYVVTLESTDGSARTDTSLLVVKI